MAHDVYDTRRFPYAIIDHTFIKDTSIGPYSKVVYMVLVMMADKETRKCFPGIESIAKLAGCSYNTVRKGLSQLEERGYIKIEKRLEGGKQTSNLYTILDIRKFSPHDERSSPGTEQAHHQVTSGTSPGTDELQPINYNHINYSTIYSQLIELYHSLCPSLPKIRTLTDGRKKVIRTRWKQYPDFDTYKQLFEKAEASNFLSGRSGDWTACNFDWLMKEANMVKVLEGNYDNKGGAPGERAGRNTQPDYIESEFAKFDK